MRTELSDGVILLQRYSRADAHDLYHAARESITDLYPWLPWCRPGYTREEAESWIEAECQAWDAGRNFEFVIRTVSGSFLGGAGINDVSTSEPMANLGYWIRTGQTSKGYASRAAQLLAKFGLGDLKLQRVEIVASVSNHGSLRVAEKAGAFREGVLRNRIMLHGQPHDAVMHSFIPDSHSD